MEDNAELALTDWILNIDCIIAVPPTCPAEFQYKYSLFSMIFQQFSVFSKELRIQCMY